MYSFESRIRYSETDGDGRLGITGLLNYFQDCATFHSNDSGLPLEALRARNQVWVLNSWQVMISRMPLMSERVVITTSPYSLHGFMGFRNFTLETPEGERLAIANSDWTLLNPETGGPTRIPDDIPEKYGLDPKLDMDYASRKIKLEGEDRGTSETIPVLRHMLDTNGHMNNSQYVRLAADCLPEGFRFRQLRVEYKKSAMPGDTLYVRVYIPEGRFIVALCGGDEKPYAVVEFS